MSLGLLLSSFATKVSVADHCGSRLEYSFLSQSALAALHHASVSLWRRLIDVVLPYDITNTAVLR